MIYFFLLNFDLVTLTLKFDLLLKNFNLGHIFQTRSDRAFILHMCIPCDKTFQMVPYYLTLWPWPWSLTYFWKTLTLAITFKPEVIGLSYCTCVFLVTRPFTWYHNFRPYDFNLEVWPTCENFNLGCYLMIVAARRASLSSDNSYFIFVLSVCLSAWYHL